MARMTVPVLIPENPRSTPAHSAAALRVAPEAKAGRDGSCRFLATFAARRTARWALAAAVLLLAGASARAQSLFATPQPVGVASSPQTVTVTFTASGGSAVNSVEVLTLGAPNLDFQADGAVNCVVPVTFPGPEICMQPVTFTPAAPGLRMGAVVLLDSNNNVLGTAYISGIGSGGLGVLVPGNLASVAGVYKSWNPTQDGIPATKANLYNPSSVTMDGAGNLYIADSNHNRVRMVAAPVPPATVGIISTVAGTGEADYTGDNHAATAATLNNPSGVALDAAGNLYIADSGNNVIRMVNAAGIITTVAGNGTAGFGSILD